ncbi:MAG: hypothetical protein ACRDOD_03525 [Streptosporangiaceae bacterium]
MTQDQYGQARGSGYVVPENETEEGRTDESKPMTRFQKVASALRGGSERDEQDEAAMAGSPISQEPGGQHDYWDDPDAAAGHEDDAFAVTSPDVPADHQATEPDMFGTTRRTGEKTAEMPTAAAAGQPGAATIADVPAARADVPAARTPADGNLRPGEAAGKLGDFSDLTYGNLVPDAEQYTAQWQEIQFRFVDDPRGSVTEAADVVAQVTAKMEAAIQERQRAIEERQHAIAEQQRTLRDQWGEGSNADTEALRATLRMYKTFLDQLIGPRAS